MSEQRDKQPPDRREVERARLQSLREMQPQRDESREPGVLLSDAILHYCQWFQLICPFDEKNLKPACYKLTIGDEYAIGGKIYPLPDRPGHNAIRIPPFAVAIIKTTETINMPPFLIGRWNIQVSRAYQGLVWVGGPQVDAGYVGHLFCPIYNLSDKEVVLYRGEPIAVIDFEKTTNFRDGRSILYRGGQLPENIVFEDYKPQQLASGLVKHAAQITSIQDRVDNFVSLTFGVVAVLFAALAIFVARQDITPVWNPSLFLICSLAIFLSTTAWLKSRAEGRYFGRAVQVILVLLLAAGFASELYRRHDLQRKMDDLQGQLLELKRNLTLRPQTASPQTSGIVPTPGKVSAQPSQKTP
jgi:deoxycytidine triphosphate deaminase